MGQNGVNIPLDKVELELQPKVNIDNGGREFVNVSNLECLHQHADVAVLVNPSVDWSKYYRYIMAPGWLADDFFMQQYVGVGADLAFLGYPQNLFDIERKLPIARHAIVASAPWYMFNHKAISTSDAVLVSGLSFGGGSGSPVFVCSRGIQLHADSGVAQSADYYPQKIVGVMTGHLKTTKSSNNHPDLFVLHFFGHCRPFRGFFFYGSLTPHSTSHLSVLRYIGGLQL